MRKAWVGMWLIFVALPAVAAVQYEFIQRTQSDVDQARPSNMTGRAVIDGEHSRVDFLTGDLYPPGTYCIANGTRTLRFVDPVMQSYTEVNPGAVAAAIGSSNIVVSNLKSDLLKLEDHPTIAGVSTEHYRLSITFDIAVQFGSMPLRQSVRTDVDKWTTIEYGDIAPSFLAGSNLHTGNANIDEFIDLETTKITGFPLKETVKISTRNLQGVNPNSKLAISEVRTQSRELIVTSIKRMTANPAEFVFPASYRRNDAQALTEKQAQTKYTVLSFDEGKP